MIPFGITRTGQQVDAITLSAHGLSATILTYGAILQDVRLDGVDHSLTLGSQTFEDYEDTMMFHGAIVGPVANRIRGASAMIAGTVYDFEANLEGQHTLHSGTAGIHNKVWQVDNVSEKSLSLSHKLPNSEAGFPANRHITATFEIVSGPTLRLAITTTTDAPSIVNATNHSYWNLDGTDHMRDHTVQVQSEHFLATGDTDVLPTGEILLVANTPYDFRQPNKLIPEHPPLDTTFCVSNTRRNLTECCWLRGACGVTMAVATTEAGMHLYDARAANRADGPFYEGLAIEAQGWPDAPNHPHFPSINVTPDAPLTQITEWRFSKT